MCNNLVGLERLVAFVEIGLDIIGALDVGDEELFGRSLGQNTTADVSIERFAEYMLLARTLG